MTEQEYKKLLIENVLNKFDKLNKIKIDAFNYGYIMGKRAERARRKGGVA